jgi:hypothetical protein
VVRVWGSTGLSSRAVGDTVKKTDGRADGKGLKRLAGKYKALYPSGDSSV